MRKTVLVVLTLLCGSSLSCGGRSPMSPAPNSRLQVFVQWQGQGLADRKLEIVELDLTQSTDSSGLAVFNIPAGTYTLRAFVNRGGPPAYTDISVTTKRGETELVEVSDCLPCVSPG